MNKYKNFALNILVFFINTVATKLISFVLIPLYTYYLNTSEYGITDMSVIVMTLLFPIASLYLTDGMIRFSIDDPDNKECYLSSSFFVVLIGCAVVALCLPLLDLHIFGGLGNYKLLFYVAFVLSSLQTYEANAARALNEMKIIPLCATSSALGTCVSAFLLIAKNHMGVPGYFYSIIFGQAVGIFMHEILGRHYRYIKAVSLKRDGRMVRRMLNYALPLVPDSIFWWMSTSVNRFIITGMLGIAASGLFAAAQKIPNLLSLMNNVFQQGWSLSAFQEFKNKDIGGFFSLIFKLYQTLAVIVSSAMILFSPAFASILLQKDFYTGWVYMPALILAFYFNAFNIFFGSVFTTTMKTNYIMFTTVVGACSSLVFTWLLIPPFGLFGAGVALVISNGLIFVLRAYISRSLLAFDVNWVVTVASTVLLICQAGITSFQAPNYMAIGALSLVVICVLQAVVLVPVIKKAKLLVRSRHAGR